MIRPRFFIIFSGLFWIAYSLRHKNQLWPWQWIKGTDEFFPKIYKKKLADWFQIKQFKWPLSIFVWTGANFKIIEKKADLWNAKKNWRLIWPKKKLFWLFTWRRLESVFQDKKKFNLEFSRIFENFFFSSWKTPSSLLNIKSRKKFFGSNRPSVFCASQISFFSMIFK